ncbi:hypothetical protein EON65_10335 [archaeon]|nr:MAG: hypothetical protein EON65_10335 [archaeon]
MSLFRKLTSSEMLAGRKNELDKAAVEPYRLKPPQKRLLEVEIIEARDLLVIKKASADTYVQGCLIDLGGREIKKECFSTKIQKDTTSPQWNEKFLFGHVYNLNTVGDLPTLNLTIFHKAPFSVAEQPMGMVSIQLEHLDTSGFQLDTWFELQKMGRMEKVAGKIHLAIKFNSPPSSGDIEMGECSALDDVEENKEEGKGDGVDGEPNELVITVLRGRKLLGISRDLLSSSRPAYSSPYVKLQLGSEHHKTKHILRNLNPTWKEQIIFKPVTDPSLTLQLSIKDHESMLDGFIGRIALSLSQFTDKKPVTKWHKLKNKKCEEDGVERGEVEVKVHWRYSSIVQQEISDSKDSMKSIKKAMHAMHHLGQMLGAEEESDEEVEGEDGGEGGEAVDREENPEDKSEEEKKKDEEHLKELESIDVKPGDYQVIVHIIEVRELKAENLDGTSDPVVFIECFKQKRNTITVKGVTSAVYDEVFIFNVKNIDKDVLEKEVIRISCRDSSPLVKGAMIGAYAFDAMTVYTMNKEHEMYRSWVPLMDDEDPQDVGVQGYMKLSVQIIGPGNASVY